MRRLGCVILLVLGTAGKAYALTVTVDSASGGTPPEITCTNNGGSPLELTFRLMNVSSLESSPVISWQLRLQIEEATAGGVLFENVAAPDGPFGDFLGPEPGIGTPTNDILESALDTSFSGVAIPAESARDIMRVGLVVSRDAEGLFTLTMSGFDPSDSDHSSFWVPGDSFAPTPFDNVLPGAQNAVLATIRVLGVPEPCSGLLMSVGAFFQWLITTRRMGRRSPWLCRTP
jgi:hypothetical protein